jgi:hypothetical protein
LAPLPDPAERKARRLREVITIAEALTFRQDWVVDRAEQAVTLWRENGSPPSGFWMAGVRAAFNLAHSDLEGVGVQLAGIQDEVGGPEQLDSLLEEPVAESVPANGKRNLDRLNALEAIVAQGPAQRQAPVEVGSVPTAGAPAASQRGTGRELECGLAPVEPETIHGMLSRRGREPGSLRPWETR